MKKKIWFILTNISLLFGVVFVNAVSIEFEDLQENNIYFEELEVINSIDEIELTENETIQPIINEEMIKLTPLIATNSEIICTSVNDGTLEYVKNVTGNAYTAFVKKCGSRFWSTSKGYDSSYNDTINHVPNSKTKNPFGVVQANAKYVPLIENIYLTRGSIIEISVFGSSCQHQPSKAILYISKPHQSPIQYASSNQMISVGTLNIPNSNGQSNTGSQIFRYVVHSNGYYTLDAFGEAYGCQMSEGHGIYITNSYKIYRYKYNISYNLNGGILNLTNPTHYYENSNSFTLNNPQKTGYSFMGWNGTGLSSITKNVIIPNGSYGNRNYTANWKINQYPVTYIDVINSIDGKVLNKTTSLIDYGVTVKGSDKGSSIANNAYHNGYYYVSDTSAKVTLDGATVYRIFEMCETEAKSNLQWNDNNNVDGFRPNKYKLKLKQNGKIIKEVELPSNETNYTFPNLPKYDSNGNAYKYTFDVDAGNRYQIEFNENRNLIIENYLPTNFCVTIPKKIILDGNKGNAHYIVSVNGTFYYNDTLTVIPESRFTLTDRNKISSMQADILQQKTVFTKEDGVSSGTTTNGSIQVNKTHFAGSWKGDFNFAITFKMQN